MLLAEGLKFSNRLKAANKKHTLRVVKGEKHAWDCPPPMTPKESVFVEYQEAIENMASWFGKKCETDTESLRSMKLKRAVFKRPKYLSYNTWSGW